MSTTTPHTVTTPRRQRRPTREVRARLNAGRPPTLRKVTNRRLVSCDRRTAALHKCHMGTVLPKRHLDARSMIPRDMSSRISSAHPAGVTLNPGGHRVSVRRCPRGKRNPPRLSVSRAGWIWAQLSCAAPVYRFELHWCNSHGAPSGSTATSRPSRPIARPPRCRHVRSRRSPRSSDHRVQSG